ncbi:hypothetical protein SK803_32955 [Lentzea sp. BCCO 10_0856]|uniref:Uncharacterized protein n=1 Tax=Lentzea miocenica TaxID=3095431 RepID=A0ABU4TA64_9PSEU|nr:hypothetical protein [Lentzea sp. BCCO 10_0856]MDX8035051.1 hypothetical protein [Lentzea sp. BCCO 10_0856]
MRTWRSTRSPQEIRQLGVVLVAATPGLALGVMAVFGALAVGLVMTRVTVVLTQTKPLRVWTIVSAVGSTTSLSTLYTD